MEYLFSSFHFHSVSVFISEVSLLQTAYKQVLFLFPFSYSVLIGTFSPFKFKTVINVYVFTAILSLVLGCFYSSFPHFLVFL